MTISSTQLTSLFIFDSIIPLRDGQYSEFVEAIKLLYENQGKDRFSSNSRLYIYLSDNEIPSKEDIISQLEKKYDITFNYEGVEYKTEGARIIFI